MSQHSADNLILSPTFVREDDRGLFVEVLNEGPWETVVHGEMHAGAVMGEHYHRQCRAYFYLMSGEAIINVRHLVDGTEDTITLAAQRGVYFLPFEVHRIEFLAESTFLLLKSYRYRDDEPDIFVE